MGYASLASPAFVVAFSFLLLSRLALHSAEDDSLVCSSFLCGNLSISHPFTNATHRECGLSTIGWENMKPMIVSDAGRRYGVKSIDRNSKTIVIHDDQKLAENNCHALFNFQTPIFPSLSFRVKTNYTWFKCDLPTPLEQLAGFHEYPHCEHFKIFYPSNPEPSLANAPITPPNCSVFYFPVLPPKDGDSWAFDFSLEWSYPSQCHDCEAKCRRDSDGTVIKCAGTKQAASAIGIGIMLTIIVLIYCLRSKLKSHNFLVFLGKETKNDHEVKAFFKNYDSLAPKKYSYLDVKKMTDSFKDKLGQGGYGSVYKGKLVDNQLVAVKVLSEFKGNGEEFINEVASITRTSHVNIVTLQGYCFEGRKRALIYEFMSHGSLEKFIHDKESLKEHPILGWDILYKIAIGIARGLEYLHRGCNTRILHFDIKPHNILLDQDFCPKISDFGLAKLCPNKEYRINVECTRDNWVHRSRSV